MHYPKKALIDLMLDLNNRLDQFTDGIITAHKEIDDLLDAGKLKEAMKKLTELQSSMQVMLDPMIFSEYYIKFLPK